MPEIPRISLPEQVAEHLREGIRQGQWSGHLPGVPRLAAELDVAPRTVRQALGLLEAEGLLGGRGPGRSRGITAADSNAIRPPLRVAILRHDVRLTDDPQSAMFMTQIMNSLEAAGHNVFFCKKSQIELKHEVRRLTRQLAECPADAWVIEAGSLPLLEWCASQPTPCHALFGRFTNQPLAGTGLDKVPAFRAATRQLVALGHRRIVLIVDEARRKPRPGISARAFLEELSADGISTGDYNLPEWEASPAGLERLLERLFLHTPPTALIIDEVARYIAALDFFARRGIKVPQQVSLVSTDDDPVLAWCHPGIAHMRWDSRPIVRRVLRWVDAVRKGKPDRKTQQPRPHSSSSR